MMRIKIMDSVLKSQRDIARESFPPYRRDRLDIYGFEGCFKDDLTLSHTTVYRIMEANCNPDFDW